MKHHVHKHQKYDKSFDRLLYFFAFTTPLFELPQAIQIFQHKSAADVAAITWIYFVISNMTFLAYGISKKLKPIIISYVLYILIEALIVVGILLYR